MNSKMHRLRIKEPQTKLQKSLEKELQLNSLYSKLNPSKIPTCSQPQFEYVHKFNDLANYYNFRNNQAFKSKELFTWTLKQQAFNKFTISENILKKTLKSVSPAKKIEFEKKKTAYNNSGDILENSKIVLNPPKRSTKIKLGRQAEEEERKRKEEEETYEENVNRFVRTKWIAMEKTKDDVKHRKLFSLTKLQKDMLLGGNNMPYSERSSEDFSLSRTQLINPFEKKNFGINKIIYYINEKKEEEKERESFYNSNEEHKEKLLHSKFGNNTDMNFATSPSKSNGKKNKQVSLNFLDQFEQKLDKCVTVDAKVKKEKGGNNAAKYGLDENNIFNYNSYFSKRYHNGGFRLELSEKNKRSINEFEKRLTQNLFKKNSISKVFMNESPKNL